MRLGSVRLFLFWLKMLNCWGFWITHN